MLLLQVLNEGLVFLCVGCHACDGGYQLLMFVLLRLLYSNRLLA